MFSVCVLCFVRFVFLCGLFSLCLCDVVLCIWCSVYVVIVVFVLFSVRFCLCTCMCSLLCVHASRDDVYVCCLCFLFCVLCCALFVSVYCVGVHCVSVFIFCLLLCVSVVFLVSCGCYVYVLCVFSLSDVISLVFVFMCMESVLYYVWLLSLYCTSPCVSMVAHFVSLGWCCLVAVYVLSSVVVLL